jgi:hypothetical protein
VIESALVAYVTPNTRVLISVSRGTVAQVEFGFENVWEFKKRQPNFQPTFLIWSHVHPSNFGSQPSEQDVKCAKAIEIAFGRLGGFKIFCFDDDDLNSIEGNVSWCWLSDGILCHKTQRIDHAIGKWAQILKCLSYAS